MPILVAGTVALDSIKTPFGERRDTLGGSATFFSIAASFFCGVDIVAVVGSDFPRRYIKMLERHGVGTKGLSIVKGKTFRWSGYYAEDLNTAHTLSTCLNVFKDFRPVIPARSKDPKILFLANADPELQRDVLMQAGSPGLSGVDSMNYWIENKRPQLERLLSSIDIFFVNDKEARQFSGEDNILKAARYILSFGPKAVIIKRGEYGVLYVSRLTRFFAPAYLSEKLRDPTGAGDTFAGGMMGYLGRAPKINESSVRRAIVYGSILASFAVQDFGVNGLLKIRSDDIGTRYKDFKRIVSF